MPCRIKSNHNQQKIYPAQTLKVCLSIVLVSLKRMLSFALFLLFYSLNLIPNLTEDRHRVKDTLLKHTLSYQGYRRCSPAEH